MAERKMMTEILNTRDGDYSVPTGLRHGRLVDHEVYTDPATQAAIEQWTQERADYDKTAVEMGISKASPRPGDSSRSVG